MSPGAGSPDPPAEKPAPTAILAGPPTPLPPPVRRRLFLALGVLVALVALGSPGGGLFEIALSLLLKNKLHLTATELATSAPWPRSRSTSRSSSA